MIKNLPKKLIATLILLFAGEWGMAADFERLPSGNLKLPLPALLIVHDVWGVDSFVKREAEKYADLGFWVIAIDLFAGKLPNDLSSAQRLKNNLDNEDAIKRIRKFYEKAANNKRIDKSRIGILGWGMGGGLAIRYAVTNPQLRTVTMIYGEPLVEEVAFQKLKVNRGLAVFAENDQDVPAAKVEQFKKTLLANNLLFDVNVIKGARAGFFDSTRSANFNPRATEEARNLINSFLQKHLSLTEHRK